MRTQHTNHGAFLGATQQTLFQLPPPPPGMQWHRMDSWREDDLPQGMRPLVANEDGEVGDEWFSWIDQNWKYCDEADRNVASTSRKHRTRRSLTFTHAGKQWTWHRPGDPMPCDGKREVCVLLIDDTPSFAAIPVEPQEVPWTRDLKIIGWRYADAEKSDPYIQKEPAIAVHDVFPKAIPGAFGAEFREKLLTTKPDEIPWIEWHGGPCPLKDEEVEEFEFKTHTGTSGALESPSVWRWSLDGNKGDIIAYRVLKWREKKPKVPLGPEDVRCGDEVQFVQGDRRAILRVTDKAVEIHELGSVSFLELQLSKARIRRRDSDAWEPCSKEVLA